MHECLLVLNLDLKGVLALSRIGSTVVFLQYHVVVLVNHDVISPAVLIEALEVWKNGISKLINIKVNKHGLKGYFVHITVPIDYGY